MNSLKSLLTAEDILSAASADTRKSVLIALSKQLSLRTGLDHHVIFEGIMERERLGSTGGGQGVAIPHARLEGIERPVGALARLIRPVDFDAIDDQPCDIVFMLLAPEQGGADHLRALARVARAFRTPGVLDALRSATDRKQMFSILCPGPSSNDSQTSEQAIKRRA